MITSKAYLIKQDQKGNLSLVRRDLTIEMLAKHHKKAEIISCFDAGGKIIFDDETIFFAAKFTTLEKSFTQYCDLYVNSEGNGIFRIRDEAVAAIRNNRIEQEVFLSSRDLKMISQMQAETGMSFLPSQD
jgi:hypothetical protein